MATPESASLRNKPAVEGRIAVDFVAFQKISVDERGQLLLSRGRESPDTVFNCACDFECVDEAIRKVQSDSIRTRLDALFPGFINQASKFAQAPAKFAPRIVWNIPQQITQL